VQKIFTKLNEALASAKALLHASRHVAESGSVALQQHRMCAVLESSVKERGKVYFADSYCSWQKGAIENANKLIRKYTSRRKPILTTSQTEELWKFRKSSTVDQGKN